MHHRRWLLFCLAILASVCRVQQSSVASAQGTSATIQVKSRLVTVNVVVTNSHGDSISGLTREDFQVLDRGEPQRIAFFSTAGPELLAEMPVSPGSVTNISALGNAAQENAVVILFDTLNSHWTSQGYGLNQVRAFLRQVNPQDRVGIYVLGDELKVVHDLNRDASDLISAIRSYDAHTIETARNAETGQSTGNEELDRFLTGKENRYRFGIEGKVSAAQRQMLSEEAFATTLSALQVILRHLQAGNGRKSIIWVTDHLPTPLLTNNIIEDAQTTYRRFGAEIDELVRLMNASGVSVYPVSSEGLQAMDLGFGPGADFHGPSLRSRDPLYTSPDGQAHLGMEELAHRTGGRAFYDRNDLATGIERAFEDGRRSYTIGYYPDHNDWKGEFRKIQVKVDRKDVTVLARSGYFALPRPAPLSPREDLERMKEIAAAPLDSTGFPFAVRSSQPGKDGSQLRLVLSFEPNKTLTQGGNNRWHGNFEALLMQIGSDGKLLDATNKSVEMDLSQAQYEEATRNLIQFPMSLTLIRGVKTLCIIMRDPASDSLGSVRISLPTPAQAQ